jgi:hypothetical protein
VGRSQHSDFPGRWGDLSSQRRGSVSSFYGVDQQADVGLLADSTGAISDSYLFTAFGEELAVTGSTINPLRFGGWWATTGISPTGCMSEPGI